MKACLASPSSNFLLLNLLHRVLLVPVFTHTFSSMIVTHLLH